MNVEILESLSLETLKELQIEIKKLISRKKKEIGISKRIDFVNSLHYQQPETLEKARVALSKINSSSPKSIYAINNKLFNRSPYLPYLIQQDWSSIFNSTNDSGDYYVYCHVDPSDRVFVTNKKAGGNYKGTPFYVGKGRGNRAFDLKRNQGHGKKITEVINKGYNQDHIVYIPFKNLNENLAYEIESKLIYFFGTIYQSDRKNTTLYNLDIPKTPEFDGVMERIPTRKELEAQKND